MKPKKTALGSFNGLNLNHRLWGYAGRQFPGITFCLRFTLRQPRESRAMATAFSPAPSPLRNFLQPVITPRCVAAASPTPKVRLQTVI